MSALAVKCGVCGAVPGQQCITGKGGLRSEPHVVRAAAAKRKKAGAGPPHSVEPPVPSWLRGKV